MIVRGNALQIPLADQSVHCVITSPPYWGLRDYGVNGQLGLEKTPEEYVANMVQVFREVWRVLRDDGTLWFNCGDSYTSGGRKERDPGQSKIHPAFEGDNFAYGLRPDTPLGLKPKDLVGIPWRLAFALQADGWYLRSDIIWAKPNPMPESVTDRPTKAHEYIFLLSKNPRYFFDAEAVKESCQSGPSDIRKMEESLPRIGGKHKILDDPLSKASQSTNIGQKRSVGSPNGRNCRSVWEISTQPFSGAHFATFPEELVKKCMFAGTSEKGCCPKCGGPWVRMVETQKAVSKPCPKEQASHEARGGIGNHTGTVGKSGSGRIDGYTKTLGWQPSCKCGEKPIPCTVLDPFSGACTVGVVAQKYNRKAVLIELKPDYCKMGKQRMAETDVAML